MPDEVEPEFFDYLQSLTPKDITIRAIPEGSVVFPRYEYFTQSNNNKQK